MHPRGMTETEREWRERVRAWRESGKTQREFAAGKPYAASTLSWWSSRIARMETVATPVFPMAPVIVRPRRAASLFVEVGKARIEVPVGFDAAHLRAVACALAAVG